MKNYIVINGAIRDVEELSLLIQFISNEIIESETAAISGIRVSTWRSDEYKNAKFIEWAKSYGVDFYFAEDLNYGGPANFFRQMRTLDNGINDLQDSDVIFKTRTDKSLLRKDALRAFIKQSGSPELMTRINDKLALEHISRTVPFMAKDMVLLGRADSMRKAISYTERTRYIAETIYSGMGPEVFLWLEYVSDKPRLSNILGKHDLRQISNELLQLQTEPLLRRYLETHEEISYLFNLWVEAFRKNFIFLSEALNIREVDSWVIDEGSWKYEIGDRESLNQIARCIPKQNQSIGREKSGNLSLKRITTNPFTKISPRKYGEIQNSDDAENSDIVLIRRETIENFLANLDDDAEAFGTALKFNIRHRDNGALLLVKNWIVTNDKNLKYISKEETVFVLERALDLACLRENWKEREDLSLLARRKRATSPTINLNIAESYYTKRKVLRSVYWFFKSWKGDQGSLGANHGLGSVLLDLRLSSIAKGFLEKAIQIAPQDKTATWTLFRCLVRLRKFSEAQGIVSRLTKENRERALKILASRTA